MYGASEFGFHPATETWCGVASNDIDSMGVTVNPRHDVPLVIYLMRKRRINGIWTQCKQMVTKGDGDAKS